MGEKFDALTDEQKTAVVTVVAFAYMMDAGGKPGFLPTGLTTEELVEHQRAHAEAEHERIAGDSSSLADAMQKFERIEESDRATPDIPPGGRVVGGRSGGRRR